jgi:cell wall-associated NlpC family hydrolase
VALAMLGCTLAGVVPRLGRTEDARGQRIVALARDIAQARVPYRSGGTSRGGFDCSGLVWYVHQQIGVVVPRRAEDQSEVAVPVALEELAPGDLLFFRLRSSRRIDHVGIYAGPDRLIHASIVHRAVSYARLDDTYFLPRVASAGRLWGPAAPPLTSPGDLPPKPDDVPASPQEIPAEAVPPLG